MLAQSLRRSATSSTRLASHLVPTTRLAECAGDRVERGQQYRENAAIAWSAVEFSRSVSLPVLFVRRRVRPQLPRHCRPHDLWQRRNTSAWRFPRWHLRASPQMSLRWLLPTCLVLRPFVTFNASLPTGGSFRSSRQAVRSASQKIAEVRMLPCARSCRPDIPVSFGTQIQPVASRVASPKKHEHSPLWLRTSRTPRTSLSLCSSRTKCASFTWARVPVQTGKQQRHGQVVPSFESLAVFKGFLVLWQSVVPREASFFVLALSPPACLSWTPLDSLLCP